MRGTLRQCVSLLRRTGIIPAYAGNTAICNRCTSILRDHPRICGEHLYIQHADWDDPGSSPHMRGTPIFAMPWTPCARIIPAYAGNTQATAPSFRLSRDHPRICGEHSSSELITIMSMGSSPHMRGTHRIQGRGCNLPGIIPAYAGNTHMTSIIVQRSWGSSPHMRGTPDATCERIAGDGIIPAYAGNTFGMDYRPSPCRDHPRICGEHATIFSFSFAR